MPLTNLTILNSLESGFGLNSNTETNAQFQLPKAYKINIRPTGQDYGVGENLVYDEDGNYGSWRVGLDDLNISGYAGSGVFNWLNLSSIIPQLGIYGANTMCRLKDTRYEPNSANLSSNLFPLSMQSFVGSQPYNIPGGYNATTGQANNQYKEWTEEKTKLYGDQDVFEWIDTYGYTDLQPVDENSYFTDENASVVDGDWIVTLATQATGEFINNSSLNTNNLMYVESDQTAAARWSKYVERVIAFDTVGYDPVFGVPLYGNTIDVFVILKDSQTVFNPLEDVLSESIAAGGNGFLKINAMDSYTYGGTDDELPGTSVVEIDFDCKATWIPFHG